MLKILPLMALTSWAGVAAAAPSSDAWITTKTKISLVTATHVNSNAVHVDTIDGRVTMHGKVTSQAQKENAEAVAKTVEGVKSVRNLLQIVPESSEKATEDSDDRIKERVEKLFKEDSLLAASNIGVKSVNKGVVLLSGKASTLSDYLRAVESTSMVTGVRGVATEVKSSDKLAQPETSRTAGGIKDAAGDSWITMTTKMRLLADRDVPALEINVDTYRGSVTLFGIVPTSEAKLAAETTTKKVNAVVSVNNELQVVPAVNKDVVDDKDSVVEQHVKMALKKRAAFKHVDVEVKNGVARLTGSVASGWDGLQAATVARGTRGVRAVDQDFHK